MINQTIAVFVSVSLVLVHIYFTKKELAKQEDKVNDLDKKVAVLESQGSDHNDIKKELQSLAILVAEIATTLKIRIKD